MRERMRIHLRSALLAVLLLLPAAGVAKEAWLVTYGPGQEVWERFGHNAIWLRDAQAGLDHVYSFGYFEPDRPGFHRDFARGIMKYYGSAARVEDEFAFYRMRDRSIGIQRLNLRDDQLRELHGLLHAAIFPIPQYYDYDYFFANCSTWLRDLIDQVVDGRVREQLEAEPARLNFRDHIRRYNQSRLELHAGLMLLLGPDIDRPRTAWEEGFVPDGLAQWMDGVRVDGHPLVAESKTLYRSQRHHAPHSPDSQIWAYALVSGLFALLVLLPVRFGAGFWPSLAWRLGLIGIGLAGTVVLVMWFASGHSVIDHNRVVLMLNPAWLLLLLPWPRVISRVLWWLLVTAALAGSAALVWPGSAQYRPEVVAGLLPLMAAVSWVAWQRVDQRKDARS